MWLFVESPHVHPQRPLRSFLLEVYPAPEDSYECSRGRSGNTVALVVRQGRFNRLRSLVCGGDILSETRGQCPRGKCSEAI